MSRRNGRSRAEISLTPMIDVMTVLLAVFMVTTPLMTTGIDLDLPRAGKSAITGRDNSVQIKSISPVPLRSPGFSPVKPYRERTDR